MTQAQKQTALLAANKVQNKTFAARAAVARQIMLADEMALDFIADAMGVQF